MKLSIATWNINSVRLRHDLVAQFAAGHRPDILCLQETKVPDDRFPLKDLQKLGYPFIAFAGQKGYNGVAILSKFPFSAEERKPMCGRDDARHIAVTLSAEAKAAAGLTIHNFYVPAGGDVADPDANPKFAHKLQFLAEMTQWSETIATIAAPSVMVGDLNIAPHEHDVWSHKQLLDVVSHTPVETQGLLAMQAAGAWIDAVRVHKPLSEKVYSWWSYRAADWNAANKGRRLDHVWLSSGLSGALREAMILREARGWERPSDHVPVVAMLEM
jgi:exodeoxyribonuclease III